MATKIERVTSLNINSKLNCDLCESETLLSIYRPLQSRYSIEVYVCDECGLIQSRKHSTPNDIVKTTSADADWGNVRHGKGLRFDLLKNEFDFEKLVHGSVLDIGSNRGDFINWVNTLDGVSRIVAVEPDSTLLSEYNEDVVLYKVKIEDVNFEKEKFDFIYCCQTLEHADSAFDMLKRIRNLLKNNSKALIDIPNTEVIKKQEIIEEYFIDKHTFHFDCSSIRKYFRKVGLKICGYHEDQYNLSYLVEACEPIEDELDVSKLITKENIAEYYNNLTSNRSNLERLVQLRIAPVLARQKCAIWGAGRTLDALIKFGGMKVDSRITIVDTYLHDKIKILGEHVIHKPSFLKLVEPQVVFILANSAEDQLAEQAYRMGIRHVIKFSEMIDQI